MNDDLKDEIIKNRDVILDRIRVRTLVNIKDQEEADRLTGLLEEE